MKKINKIMKKFASAMVSARKSFGMSQAQLAGILGCSHNSVWAWEVGKSFPIRRLRATILKELGVDVNVYEREAYCIPNSGFGNILFEIRNESNMTRSDFIRVLKVEKRDLDSWEEGRDIPSLRVLANIEERLNDAPRIEELRPAWEEALAKLSPADQAYKRGDTPKGKKVVEVEKPVVSEPAAPAEPEPPVPEPTVEEKPAETQVSPRQAMRAAMAGKPIVDKPVAVPTVPHAKVSTGEIKVSLSRVVARADAAGYKMGTWRNLPKVLYQFAEVVVAEEYNARERRSSVEIPWPLPLEPGASRCEYIARVDGKIISFTHILDFNYTGYLSEHGLTPVLVMNDSEETAGFFHK